VVGFLTLIPLVARLVPLPITDGIPIGALAWSAVGALAALWRATLARTLASVAGAIGIAVIGVGALIRADTNTPWFLTPDRFAIDLGLTVVIALAAVVVGYLATSLLRGRKPLGDVNWRGLAAALLISVLAVGGGTLFAERIQAVIPFGAQRPALTISHDGVQLVPGGFASGPTYWTIMNLDLPGSADQPGYEVGILRIASDSERALRLTGEMGGTYESGSRVFGWIGIPSSGTSYIRRGDLEAGRYLLMVVETLPPQVEGQPDNGGESADRVLVDNLYVEFTVTD